MRPLVEEDVLAASALMADAFIDDPVMTWLFPDMALRPGRMRRYYELDLHHRLVPTAGAITTTGMGGVACWVPPGREQIPFLTKARIAPAFWSLIGTRMLGALRFLRDLEDAHPAEPHWYLAHLATRPNHQGRGVGTALVRFGIDRCDRERLPAYLESSNLLSVSFYRGFGFEVIDRVTARDGPTVTLMWREPS